MANKDQKTEQATPRRLQKAREEGTFPSARIFVGALQFLAFVAMLRSWGSTWIAATHSTMSRLLAPGGLVFLSTLNRTPRSYVTAILGAEYLLRLLPVGTHDWRRLLTPVEVARLGRAAGLRVVDTAGLLPAPVSGGWRVGRDLGVNYLIALASIITALGLRSILSGFAWIVTCRHQVKPYALHLIGASLVFLLQVEFWWGTFTKRLVVHWRFDYLLCFLLTPILYYVVAELLFPSRAPAEISFAVHYWANFRWFYGVAAIIQLNNVLVDHLMPTDGPSFIANTIRLTAFGFLTFMALVRSERVHLSAYVALVVLFVAFVGLVSPKL